MKQFKHVSPQERDHTTFIDHLLAYNESVQRYLSEEFMALFPNNHEGFCLATTGSDARLEKGPVSPIEFIIFQEGLEDTAHATQRFEEWVQEQDPNIFFPDLDIKDTEKGVMYELTKFEGTPNEITLISPNRIFDARYIHGNQHLIRKGKKRLAREMCTDQGKKVFERIKERTRQHRKVSVEGLQSYKGELLKHYDLEEGVVFYDPSRRLHSFKQGPLRAVQFALVRDMIKELRKGSSESVILPLSSSTVYKLNTIEVQGNTALSAQQVQDLSDSYKYFLWQYHRSQAAYLEGSNQTSFDAGEARERLQDLSAICQKQIIKIRRD